MIAVLGGTFDPIHFGHLRPALEIVERFELRECRLIPSATPPHRWQPKASAAHRLNMVQAAIKQYPKFVLDDREYQREGASYTVDTLQSIRDEIGESEPLAMILGMDAFQFFTQWHQWQHIFEIAHVIVATRPNYRNEVKYEDWVQTRLVNEPAQLKQSAAGGVFFCEVTQLDISATFIRQQVKAGQDCDYLTPKNVVNYLKKHNLYQA